MRRGKLFRTTAALGLVAALGLSACGGSTDEAETETTTDEAGSGSGGSEIELSAIDNEFQPTDLKVPAGEEVTVNFTNDGETVHTFTSEELGFDSGNVEGGESTTVTFTAPDDDVEFICTIHEASDDMVGTITPE